jgi:hypothetical protein
VRAEDFFVLRLAEDVLLPAGLLVPEEVFLAEEVFFER